MKHRIIYGFGAFELRPDGNLFFVFRDGTEETLSVLMSPGDRLELASDRGISYTILFEELSVTK